VNQETKPETRVEPSVHLYAGASYTPAVKTDIRQRFAAMSAAIGPDSTEQEEYERDRT
jgi:hypothetical protein